MGATDEIETAIRTVGRELHAAIRGVPPAFDTGQWIGKLLDRAMKSDDFRTSLFRFIDVLPSLRTDELAVRLVREYFGDDPGMPGIMRRALGVLPEKGLSARIAGPVIRKAVTVVARQFIAGSSPRDSVSTLRKLRAGGAEFTVDLLGEVVVSDAEAKAYAEGYLELIDLLHTHFPQAAEASLKVTSFDSRLDPVDWDGSILRAKEGLRPVLRKAKELGAALTLDMEHSHYKALTIAVFKSLLEEDEFRELPIMGIALQAYLMDTERDLRELIRWARERRRSIGVRLVKGAYWDYEVVRNRQLGWPVPVFVNKQETDRQFELLTRVLFENTDVVRPAIASHNVRSVSHAVVVAESLGVPRESFEFQMLYGMAEPLRKAVQEKKFTVRVYAPMGELIPGMAYLVRRLLENTSNTSFLRRSFGQGTSFEEMIQRPDPPEQPGPEAPSVDGFRNEPLLDFSLAVNRKGMTDAVSAVRKGMGGNCPLIRGKERVRTAQETASRNPACPEEVVGYVSSASRSDCDAAIGEAQRVRESWRRTAAEERSHFLFNAAGEMRKQRFELAALEVIEAGKTWKDADGDVAEAIDYLEYYGRGMLRFGKPKRLGNYPGEENYYRYVSKGIAAVIAPWNFPLAIATGMTSAAIAAGNCAIFKPSGLSPVIGYRLCDIFQSVGLPPGVLQFLPGPGSEVGEYLVSHPAVDLIAFTGSKEVGLRIVQLAGETRQGQRNVKKVIAELGGKNAVIVDATADLDEAVKGVVESAFGYQGQKCSACSRVIVEREAYAEFCDRLREAVRSIRIGPPEDPSNSMGPMIDEKALEKVLAYIEIGKQEATPLIVREESPGEGFFAGPAVFVDVRPDSRLAQEEIFGPILSVMQVRDVDEALSVANNSRYALTGGLYSRSPGNIRKVKEEFVVGNLYINRKITGALVGRQPFGGFGMSGVGSKAGGPDYLLHFMNPVSVSENTMRGGFAPFADTRKRE